MIKCLKIYSIKMFVVLLLMLFIIPTIIVNANEPGNDDQKLNFPKSATSEMTQGNVRESRQNIKNITDFSEGVFENVELDQDGNLGLIWDLPKNQLENDPNTLLLNHYENSMIGYDNEEPTRYSRSTTNLQGLWELDEGKGTIAYDTSGNNRDGLIIGPTWALDKEFGTVLNFDGIDDYISTTFNPAENGHYTIEAWIKMTANTNWKTIMGTYDGLGNGYIFGFVNGLMVTYSENGGVIVLNSNKITLNAWHFIGFVYDGSYVRHYINGTEVKSQAATLSSNPNLNLYIGAFGTGGLSGVNFAGPMKHVAYYNRAKTPEEIYINYEERLANDVLFTAGKFSKAISIEENTTFGYPVGMSNDGLCAGFWRFNEGSGTIANDISGNDNDGTLNNGPQWVSGRDGNAILFDGVDDYVDCGADKTLELNTYSITFEGWIKHQFTPGSHTYGNVLRKHWSGGNWIRFEANLEYISFNLYGVGLCKGSTTLKPDVWYHVACTYDGAYMKIYLNGELDAQVIRTNPITSSVSDNLYIGASNSAGSEPWKGLIDEIAIYNRTKTTEEIYYDYLAGGQRNFIMKQGTIDLWFRPSWNGNDGINHTIFFTGKKWDNDSLIIVKTDSNNLLFKTSDNMSNSQNNAAVNIASWSAGTWYHLVFTWDEAGNKEIYINGILAASAQNGISPNRTYSKMYIGTISDINFNSMNGTIDEFRISDRKRVIDEYREYHPRGVYESPSIDIGEKVDWVTIGWNMIEKPETLLSLQIKTSQDNLIWTNWTGNRIGINGELLYLDSAGEPINAENSRYIKWRATFISTYGMFTPLLSKVNLTWNYLPTIYNISITPAEPTVLDDLVVNYSYSDADNDLEGDARLEWFIKSGNGFLSSGIAGRFVPASRTRLGEVWYCNITPHDGKTFGETYQTNSVTIRIGPIVRVQVTPKNATITAMDDVVFTAIAYDAEDNQVTTTFTWSTTGGGEIDQTGKFIPEQTGTHGVYATAGEVSGYALVIVQPGPISKIEIMPRNPIITTDEVIQFHAMIVDAKNNPIPDKIINWSIDGGGSISTAGLFDPSKPGQWTVTANVTGILAQTKVTVLPGKPDEIQLTTNNPVITADDQQQFVVNVLDADGNPVQVNAVWEVERGEFTPDGMYIPDQAGIWNVTGSIPGTILSVKTKITVLRGKASTLMVEPIVHVLKINQSVKFTVTAFDIKGNSWVPTTNLTWSVSDTSLGFIISDGTFTAKKVGKTMIIATYSNPVKTNDSNGNQTNGNGNGNGNGDGNGTGNKTNDNSTNGNSSRTLIHLPIPTRADNDGLVTGTSEVTIYDDSIPETPPPRERTKKESLGLFEGENMMLMILIIVFIIIILIFLILFFRSRREGEVPTPRIKAVPEKEPEEVEEPRVTELEAEELEEPEAEEPEVEEKEPLPLEKEEAEVSGWEVVDEEEDEELEDIDLEEIELEDEKEVEPVKKSTVPTKGKMPVPTKGKMPSKGKMPAKGKMPDEDQDLDFDLSDDVLKPDKTTARPLGVPQLMIAKDSVKCNICLGYIKPGLTEIHCKCGKHYHEQCADRVGLCPVCDTDLSEPVDLTDEEEVE